MVFSKFQTLETTCHSYVHPWNKSCVESSLELIKPCVKESLRIYLTAYTISLLMRGKIPTRKDIEKTVFGVLQSCLFLTAHGVGYSSANCITRLILGHFNFLTVSFIPSFVSSIIAILIERPSRRGLLSLYVTNVASETLFKMAVDRKLLKPIPYGEVVLFSISAAYLLYFYRGIGLPKDPIYSLLRFLIGPSEEYQFSRLSTANPPPPSLREIKCEHSFLIQYKLKFENYWKQFVFKFKYLLPNFNCPHEFSCAYYAVQGGAQVFTIGYLLQITLRVLLNIKKITNNPALALKIPFKFENMTLAVCFSGFTTIFRSFSCFCRRKFGRDRAIFALPAGFLAGLSFYFYRDTTIALYFMWKAIQLSYNFGVAKGVLYELPGANVFFHAFSTAVLFHVAILEPHNLRLSYWNFLQAMSGGRIADMDRICIDRFGLDTSRHLAEVLAKTRTKS